jgi:hypothetical protein
MLGMKKLRLLLMSAKIAILPPSTLSLKLLFSQSGDSSAIPSMVETSDEISLSSALWRAILQTTSSFQTRKTPI